MKKFVAFLMALAMLLSTSALAEISYPVDNDVTLVMWRVLDQDIVGAGYTSSNDTPGVQNWITGSGIKFEIKEFADNDSMLLALAADDLPDLFILDYNLYSGGVIGMVNDGLTIEITEEMVMENAPDYWAVLNSQPLYRQYVTQLDCKMYNMSSLIFEPNSIYRFWQQLTYRGDLLEKYGKTVPATNEEFRDLLIFARDNMEGIEIPFVMDAAHLTTFVESGYCSSAYGLVAPLDYQTDGVFHVGYYDPEYREVMRFMNDLYQEGLISPDFASMDQATAQSAFTNGTALVICTNNSRMSTLKDAVAQDGGYMVGGPVLHGADQEAAYYSFADPYINSTFSVFITPESKHPELCMQLINYLYTDEGNIVRNYGVEGKSFEYVDGVPTYTEYVTNNPNGYSADSMIRTEALINWPGIHAGPMLAARHPEQSQLDSYILQEASSKPDEHVIVYTGVMAENLDEYTDLWTDIRTYILECRTKFIAGEMNLDADFDAYRETLKSMGIERVIEIKQATLDAFNAAFN